MGKYLIPNAKSSAEAAAHPPFRAGRRWTVAEAGVLFEDPELTDAQCEALYAGFVASGKDDERWMPPLPFDLDEHLPHLRDYFAADPANITNAQTVHVVKDIIRALRYLNTRLE